MPRISYVGPHARAVVPLPSGRSVEVERFGSVDVSQDVAEGLLRQPTNWRVPHAEPRHETPDEGTTEEGDE